MNEQMQSGMEEATRLTRQGRLDEATAAIQRALGGTFVPTGEPGGSSDEPIDEDRGQVLTRLFTSQPRGSHQRQACAPVVSGGRRRRNGRRRRAYQKEHISSSDRTRTAREVVLTSCTSRAAM